MSHLTTSDLIFSEQANHNFSEILGDLKRSTLSIRNRLLSIVSDADFVEKVQQVYRRPLVANERCGSWYIRPQHKGGSAYFKSTDGHTGIWFFSTRRLNLQLLELIESNKGIMVVDSTRRGKRMPDALSKTIPIWCCVLNRALFPHAADKHDLYTPPKVVSSSEHAQIVARIPALLDSFLALGLDLGNLREKIRMPIRPVWVTPESSLDVHAALGISNEVSENSVFRNFHPIVCCTSSRRVAGTEVGEGGYIQGAGDDTENWAHGLTPPVFWKNADLLLSLPEEELSYAIERLVAEAETGSSSQGVPLLISPTSSLHVTTNYILQSQPQTTAHLRIVLLPDITPQENWKTNPTTLSIGLGAHKIGSRNLRSALPIITSFLQTHLSQNSSTDRAISISCSSGKDFSVGIALAVLCLYYDDSGRLSEWDVVGDDPKRNIDKGFIKQRLSWLMLAMPDANPSRATLQSVNSFLMERPK